MRIVDYLKATAEKYPDKIAFADEKNSISFKDFYDRAQTLASEIEGRNKAVMVEVGRDAASLVKIFSVLLSGNAYVPVDVKASPERKAEIQSQIEGADTEGLAYILFTSGSTGKPKGVEIKEESVVNFMESFTSAMDIDENTIFANQSPFYFDASMEEIYATIKCGCTTFIMPKKYFSFPKLFTDCVINNRINTLNLATTAFNIIAESGVLSQYPLTGLKLVIVGGETMHAKQLNIWKKACPQAKFVNAYGPTEVTVECTYYFADREFSDDEDVPIGKPCPGVEIFLDDGEMLVASKGLARGYLGDPEKTAQSFVMWNGRRVYRTGDFVKTDADGNFVFAGRKDNRIKHAGYRIEIGEVEAAVAGLVSEVCCIFREDEDKIICFYSGSADEKSLAAAVRKLLPAYMLPGEYIKMDVLPKNANDKIDRNKLQSER